jgi:hypothetical protein
MSHSETGLLRVLLELVSEFAPDVVLLENVPSAVRMGQLQLIRNALGKTYTISHGNYTAASVGLSHYRNRLFVLAIKKTSSFSIPQLPANCLASLVGPSLGTEPARCVDKAQEGWRDAMHALGNSVVPAVVLLAFARLTNQQHVMLPLLPARLVLEFSDSFYHHKGRLSGRRKLKMLEGVEYRLLWATPRASALGAYLELTPRGLWDLGTQVRFERGTVGREGRVSPLWVAWLMGYPPNYIQI